MEMCMVERLGVGRSWVIMMSATPYSNLLSKNVCMKEQEYE